MQMADGSDELNWPQMFTNPHIGVDLFLQATDLSQMLAYRFLKVQDTATLLLRVAGDL